MDRQPGGTPQDADPATPAARAPWCAPRLHRMGTVAAMTSKVDNLGKNDGGKWPKRRT